LLQSSEIDSNVFFIQRLAAPIPLSFDTVSLKVCLVPKLARVTISSFILSLEISLIILNITLS
jgi:hypothetical protein